MCPVRADPSRPKARVPAEPWPAPHGWYRSTAAIAENSANTPAARSARSSTPQRNLAFTASPSTLRARTAAFSTTRNGPRATTSSDCTGSLRHTPASRLGYSARRKVRYRSCAGLKPRLCHRQAMSNQCLRCAASTTSTMSSDPSTMCVTSRSTKARSAFRKSWQLAAGWNR